jgi:hypothetical protein
MPLTDKLRKESTRVRHEWHTFERAFGRAPFDELPKTALRAAVELAERQGDRARALGLHSDGNADAD